MTVSTGIQLDSPQSGILPFGFSNSYFGACVENPVVYELLKRGI
jgi:hypothetical protein